MTQLNRTTVTAISNQQERTGDTTESDNSFVRLLAGLSSIHVQQHLARPQQLPSVDQSGPEAWGRQLPPMQTSGETEQMLSSLSWSSNVQLGIGSLCQGTDAKRGINIIIVQCEVKPRFCLQRSQNPVLCNLQQHTQKCNYSGARA